MLNLISSLMERLFGKPYLESELQKLHEIIQIVQEKEQLVALKIEQLNAEAHIRANNKPAAMHSLKLKKLYVQHIEYLGNLQLCLNEQVRLILLNRQFFYRNINDVDKTMDEINDQTEKLKQSQDALSIPFGAAANFNEDELEAEFRELQGERHSETTPFPNAPFRRPRQDR